ncbi:two-component sensor histidine kinase [Altererythrobacter sp. SALINAS58]|uniref:sensor histidine kinase n=1 Tax=Alteripontixanthobacter muriae TaxID=2705546 RepID=UPI0015759754|nr:ATP-binding protein [Alteripontixanthobacter muriae]NTZ43883.1 two-component sensor histidine kinase [Alteripontixanthobacter muriae]
MIRLWPRSLLGQVLLWTALALLAAQGISAVLLYRAAEERREAEMLNTAAFRFIAHETGQGLERSRDRRSDRSARRARRGPPLTTSANLPVALTGQRQPAREAALGEILKVQNISFEDIAVGRASVADDPASLAWLTRRGRGGSADAADRQVMLAAILRDDGTWLVSRQPERRREPRVWRGIVLQTAIIYLVLVGGLALLLRRTTRPLADLTRRVDDFGRAPAGQLPDDLPEKLRGPEDVQRLVSAQQAMERRIAAMLNEKDVMLGAIGHDLKTPLAALRVRIETVEDNAERRKMAASIDDLSQTLDDILALARIGRSDQPPERAELSTLVTAVVEEFEDMGAQVELGPMMRIVRPVQVTLLRRALRNLVSNALRYGELARVSVKEEGGAALLRVEDEGPGIAEDQIGAMMEPFIRGEASRNRATGGSGLGLAIARAIAESLGGKLVLANRSEGGLRAEIRIP